MREKLIRDRIPQMASIPHQRLRRAGDDGEFIRFLETKLGEELEEFKTSRSLEELADILEVVETLCQALGSEILTLTQMQDTKRSRNGGFHERYILRLD
ncbi:MAG TPA: nucleoside triphosphate pyrophosphohydrolase [Thermoanaerobaculia bacterium]|nr:nucleoside triphosphate pyrophosphohydrolase [Thermoanaerobaculia bacterium]